jgi:FkbM family methyltransferase
MKIQSFVIHIFAVLYVKFRFKVPNFFLIFCKKVWLWWLILPDYIYFLNNNYDYYLKNWISLKNWKIKWKAYNTLIAWLDIESKNVVDTIIKRIYKVKDKKTWDYELFDENNLKLRQEIKKARKNYKYYWYLPINYREDSVFYYWNWLKNLKENLVFDLNGKDILDCGAFVWDSDIVFDKKIQNYRKIYCFEPLTRTYNLLRKTIDKNRKQDKFIPVKLGVWDKAETLTIKFWGSASSIENTKLKWKSEQIWIVKLDDYVKQNQIKPWLIKWDIEWFELKSVKWAEQTIKKYKPILLVSIYHTGKDFFEIKPLIESWNLNYKFKITHNNPFSLFYETTLICY